MRRVDDFLLCIQDIIQNRRSSVPEPVMDDITQQLLLPRLMVA